MKRLIELDPQDTGCRFAWWDTVKDRFEEHSGMWGWSTWREFEMDYEGTELERYRRLYFGNNDPKEHRD